jgi:hypothetical protein
VNSNCIIRVINDDYVSAMNERTAMDGRNSIRKTNPFKLPPAKGRCPQHGATTGNIPRL